MERMTKFFDKLHDATEYFFAHWKQIVGISCFFLVINFAILMMVNAWFQRHYFEFKFPIKITLQSPLAVKDRQKMIILSPMAIDNKIATSSPTLKEKPQKQSKNGVVYANERNPSDQEIVDYIKSKDWPIGIAIPLSMSENGYSMNGNRYKCDQTHVNDNGSIDRGIFQINSIHDRDYAPGDMFDCFKNIDYAFENIYIVQGNFGAWSAYTNGNWNNYINWPEWLAKSTNL